ncbi:hypothetical protein HYU94_00335 [Candidatus Daviesbacteria bacterium]|nr:hypothetical protein [Candidatus Daviesbacteria bacterium]
MDTTKKQVIPDQPTSKKSVNDSSIQNQKGFTLIILGVIVLLIVVAGGAYYFGMQNGKSSVTSQPQITTNPTAAPSTSTTTTQPSPTSIPDSNLKMYTNQKMGFTIKYPSSLYVKEFETSVVFTSEPYPTTEGPGPIDLIEISLKGSYMASQFDALFKANVGDDVPEAHNAVDVKITKLKNLKFGKYDAVEYIRDGITPPKSGLGRGPIGYEHNVLIKKNNQEFIDLLNDSMEVAKTQSRDPVFNEMVSSFVLK